MQSITMTPIGTVRNQIGAKKEDFWGDSESTIELDPTCFTPEALAGLSEFSHIEVLFHFHNFPEERIVRSQRHPHENPNWPRVGIFAQRGKEYRLVSQLNLIRTPIIVSSHRTNGWKAYGQQTRQRVMPSELSP